MKKAFTLLVISFLYCAGTHAQQPAFETRLYGCWKNNRDPQSRFVINSDGSCLGMLPARTDTLHGNWAIRKVYSIPFNFTVLVLKYPHRKERLEIGCDTAKNCSLFDIRRKQEYFHEK